MQLLFNKINHQLGTVLYRNTLGVNRWTSAVPLRGLCSRNDLNVDGYIFAN